MMKLIGIFTRVLATRSLRRGTASGGSRRVLGLLKGDESILDLGCGNGSWRELTAVIAARILAWTSACRCSEMLIRNPRSFLLLS